VRIARPTLDADQLMVGAAELVFTNLLRDPSASLHARNNSSATSAPTVA
jgi:hypothetical protein